MTTRLGLFIVCLIAGLPSFVQGQCFEGSPHSIISVGSSDTPLFRGSEYNSHLPDRMTQNQNVRSTEVDALWQGGEVKFLRGFGDGIQIPTLNSTGLYSPGLHSPGHYSTGRDTVIRGQDSEGSGGGGNLAGDATNPTSNLTQYQVQNTFVPSTYEASGFAHILGLQMVKPFETGNCFFPTLVTRTTLPVVTTADPAGSVPIGPPNGGGFSIPLDNQSGLGDVVFISIFNHPTDWGSWGIGPGFVAPTATRRELGEQSWKFSPTFAVVNTSIPTWQFGILGIYNFPLDGRGTKSLLFQPLIVKQLGDGWYTGWGDDLWSFNTESGNFDMPLQLRLGKVHKIGQHNYNIALTGAYTPNELHKGPAPEWGIKLSFTLLVPSSGN